MSQLLPPAQVAEITAGYMRVMPAGSWLVFSTEHITDHPLRPQLAKLYGVDRFYDHCQAMVASLFRDLDLVEPGIAEARRWLAPGGVPAESDQPGYMLCAAGIKPMAS